MNAREYIDQVVKPLFARLYSDHDSIDLQVATSIIVFHACDYIANENGERPSDVVERIKAQNADFELIHAAANANKHHTITRSPQNFLHLSDPQNPATIETVMFNGEDIMWNGEPLLFTNLTHYLSTDGRKVPIIKLLEEIIDLIDNEA